MCGGNSCAETVYCWLGASHVSSDLLICVSLYNNNNKFGYTQTFRKRGTSANHGQQPFYPHTYRLATEEAGRVLETYHKTRFEDILGPHKFLVHQSCDSRIHGQVPETQKIRTSRRRALSIFWRNYLRWTEEPPRLHCHRRDRRNVQQSPPHRRKALHQHPHRWVIYVCMYSAPNRPFSLLQGAGKTLLQPYGWNNWSMGLLSSGRFPAELYQSTALYLWSIPPHTNYHRYPIWYYKILMQTIVTPSLQYR